MPVSSRNSFMSAIPCTPELMLHKTLLTKTWLLKTLLLKTWLCKTWLLKNCLLAVLLLGSTVTAADISINSRFSIMPDFALNEGSQFALNLQRIETDWAQGNNLTQNRINRIFVSFHEATYSWFHPGIKLGYISLTQSGNPATTGRDLAGEMLGFSARFTAPAMVFNPQLDVDYSYHQSENNDEIQNITLQWFELSVKAGFFIKLGPVHLGMGGFYHTIEGDELARGAITRSDRFSEDESAGGFADLKLFVDRTGSLSVHIESGGRESVNLIFAREY